MKEKFRRLREKASEAIAYCVGWRFTGSPYDEAA
jgi:hypothetical protein